jgi:hypothetical protein
MHEFVQTLLTVAATPVVTLTSKHDARGSATARGTASGSRTSSLGPLPRVMAIPGDAPFQRRLEQAVAGGAQGLSCPPLPKRTRCGRCRCRNAMRTRRVRRKRPIPSVRDFVAIGGVGP